MTFDEWYCRFCAKGAIDPIYLGCPRGKVEATLGPPDSTGGTSRKHKIPTIWRYGALEFHFGPGEQGKLELIYEETKSGNVKVSIPRRMPKLTEKYNLLRDGWLVASSDDPDEIWELVEQGDEVVDQDWEPCQEFLPF